MARSTPVPFELMVMRHIAKRGRLPDGEGIESLAAQAAAMKLLLRGWLDERGKGRWRVTEAGQQALDLADHV